MPETEQQQTEQQEAPPSVRDALAAAMDEGETHDEADGTVDGPTEEAEPEQTAEASTEETDDAGDTQQAETPEAEAETEALPLEPPEHWSKEDQDLFLEQPAKVQQYLLDRSKAMEAAHTQRSQEIAPLRNVVGQWDGYLKQIQADPAQMFHSLLGFEYQLRSGTNEQKIQTLMQLAQAYGVEFAQQQAEPSAEEDPFGIQKQIAAAVDPIKQQLGQVSGGFQQQNQQTQQAEQARLQQQVRDFADEKGADGKLAHPYFSEVRQDMAALAQAKAAAGQPQDIAELYETACWSNPSVRAKMQAAAERKAEATKRKAEQERAKKAKRAAGSLSGSGGGGSTEQPKGLREQLEANYDAAAS